jgi:hypothetical protein
MSVMLRSVPPGNEPNQPRVDLPLLETGDRLDQKTFPGLWLDGAALLRRDRKRILKVLHQVLATPDHIAFVARLAQLASKQRQARN